MPLYGNTLAATIQHPPVRLLGMPMVGHYLQDVDLSAEKEQVLQCSLVVIDGSWKMQFALRAFCNLSPPRHSCISGWSPAWLSVPARVAFGVAYGRVACVAWSVARPLGCRRPGNKVRQLVMRSFLAIDMFVFELITICHLPVYHLVLHLRSCRHRLHQPRLVQRSGRQSYCNCLARRPDLGRHQRQHRQLAA